MWHNRNPTYRQMSNNSKYGFAAFHPQSRLLLSSITSCTQKNLFRGPARDTGAEVLIIDNPVGSGYSSSERVPADWT